MLLISAQANSDISVLKRFYDYNDKNQKMIISNLSDLENVIKATFHINTVAKDNLLSILSSAITQYNLHGHLSIKFYHNIIVDVLNKYIDNYLTMNKE